MVAAPSAHATFPGANGKIAFEGNSSKYSFGDIWAVNPDGTGPTDLSNNAASDGQPAWSPDGTKIAFYSPSAGNLDIYTMNADGTGRARLTTNPDNEGNPAWSPDGTKIAFARGSQGIFTMNADGTNQTQISNTAGVNYPAWSPDGTKIAFHRNLDIWTMTADGTGQTQLTNTPGFDNGEPSWSPDGTKIAFNTTRNEPDPSACGPCNDEVFAMNADGTNQTRLTNNPASDYGPRWSPDGTKIAFVTNREEPNPSNCAPCNYGIYTMNPDGTNQRRVMPQTGTWPDWQPIPITAYARPKGATPFMTFLVPAYKQCTAPDRAHGAPLSFGSCSPPQQASSYLTVGTPDSNGLAPSSRGSVQYTTVIGNPSTPANEADLKIDVDIVGVLNKAGLSPYSGQLSANVGLRITDRSNTPSPGGPGAATVQDGSFPVTVSCATSHCAVSTTANAVMPGSVVEGQRAVWELGQVKVYDGGANGVAGSSDATLFMDQGVFVP
jgi:dipeptidyl aminopeptidase/acylaminoacyl peptidase